MGLFGQFFHVLGVDRSRDPIEKQTLIAVEHRRSENGNNILSGLLYTSPSPRDS